MVINMLLEIPAYITIDALLAFARSQDHAIKIQPDGRYLMVPVPPMDNIVQPPERLQRPTIAEVAKQLNINHHTLYATLRAAGAINNNNLPTPWAAEQKYIYTSDRLRKSAFTGRTTPYRVAVVTDAGIEWIKTQIESQQKQEQSAS